MKRVIAARSIMSSEGVQSRSPRAIGAECIAATPPQPLSAPRVDTLVTRAVLLACVVLVLAAPEAAARVAPRVIMQDDAALLHRGPEVRERSLDEMHRLGVDAIRVLVVWRDHVPAARRTRKPLDFDDTDPAAYPLGALDGLVDGASRRGLEVILTPTGPGPAWASGCPARRQACAPQPDHFRRFVAALARRYPGLHHWAVWNEPNNPHWLTPQFRDGRPFAPGHYRRLVRAAAQALRQTRHEDDELLAGETAPIGFARGRGARTPMMPGPFLQRLLCERCAKLDGVTGIAHHAYTRGGSRPPRFPSRPGELAIASLAHVTSLVRRAEASGVLERGAGVHLTEGGWQTNPPDRIFGVRPAIQARWLNEAEWIVRSHPRVRSVGQYLLTDERDTDRFQSGLRFADGTPKPALRAYRLPLWVTRRGSTVTVWGSARARAPDLPATVEIQRRLRDGTWRTIATTSAARDMLVSVKAARGRWRLRWGPLTSRVAGEATR
jgi:hypothetical protein